ncbi:MAG: O-methyltransferase [Gemmatimonadaceae bacterium]|nr:O-methyltransferase [Gemmatimonadaceae bacterium]MDQ3519959.1 O-methyltransferase [Gemmatimonadota bacterium]
MTEDQWTEVDQYFSESLLPSDPVLESALEASVTAGLPAISVSPNQGKFLQMLAQIAGVRSILEIGTLGGYSTIWLARALGSGGRLITLEVDPKHAEVARLNVSRARLQDVVEVRIGNALETLPQLLAERCGPFDLIFIDADKQNIPAYFEWSLKLSRPGTLMVVDNVVRNGAVIDVDSSDPSVQGVRRFIEQLGTQSGATGTVIQTVGSKGYDGFAIVRVGLAASYEAG